MKCAVLIMSTDSNPSLRNIEAMKDTFMRQSNELVENGVLLHQYDFFVYYADEKMEHDAVECINDTELCNLHYIKIGLQESVYTTYEKTYKVFETVQDKFDIIIRINISTFLNIVLFDKIINSLNPDIIYGNALNAVMNLDSKYANVIYTRGDFMIMSNTVLKGILKYGSCLLNCDHIMKNRIEVTHVDDVLMGIAFYEYMKSLNKNYIEYLRMLYYNFIPNATISEGISISRFAIASRVKTIPPDVNFSGYSWDDNEYRKIDVEKMWLLHNYYTQCADQIPNVTDISELYVANVNLRQITGVQIAILPFEQ